MTPTILAEITRWRRDLSARFTMDESGPENVMSWRFTLRELIEANLDSPLEPSELESLRRARVGDEVRLGGGAAAEAVLRRVG